MANKRFNPKQPYHFGTPTATQPGNKKSPGGANTAGNQQISPLRKTTSYDKKNMPEEGRPKGTWGGGRGRP